MPARRSDYTLLSQLGDIPYQSLDSSLPEQKKLLEKTPLISLEERLDRNFPRKAVVPFGHVEKSSFGVSGKVPLSYRDQSVSSGLDRGRDLVENHSDRISSAFHDRGHTCSYTEWNSCLPADRFSFSSVGERCSSVSLDRSPPVVAGEQYGNQSFDQSLFRAGLWSSLDRSYAGDGSIGGYGGTFLPGSSMLQRQSSGSSFTDSLLSTDVPLSTLSPTISLSTSESTLFGAYYDDACKQDAAKGTKQSEGSSQSWAQQIVQSYNLQLALALRLVGEAELTEEPLLKFQAKESLLGTGSAARTSVEATALRFWVNGSLGYNDKIRDGFYHIWGMNPYVWAICNDSDEGGRMPSLDSLRAVNPAESSLEVILFDKHGDSHLRELENQAVGLVYKATDSIELAEWLAKLVGDQMGGTAPLEHRELMAQWKAASRMLKDCLSCVVIPVGSLSVGLCRHRALLFKALADSVDLPCRVTRGCKYCGLDDGASCLVLCRNEREFLVDLVAQPGTLCNPESFLRSLPSLPVSSPLRLPDLMFSEITGDDGSLVKNSKSKGKVVDALGTAPGWQDPFESPLVAESVPREKNRSSWEKSGPMFSGKVPVSAKLASIWPALEHSVITTTEGERMVISRSPSTNMLKSLSGSNAIIDSERITSEGRRVASHITSTAVLDGVKAGEPMVPNDTSMLKKEPLQNNFASTAQGKVDTDFSPQQLTLQSQKQAGLDGSFNASLKGMDRTEERLLELTEEQGETRVKTQSLEQALALEGLEIPWEELTLRERIGAGSFGTVHRADWHGSDVAVKILIEQDLYDERLKEFMREVALMKRMRHPNVVLFMGAVTKRPNLSIVTEYLPRGSLFRLLHRTGVRESLDERRRIRMALDVARGMNYLHRLNPPIVHRDLKSPNLLVDKTWTVKVCDFGLSRFKANTFLSSRSAAGTPEWMAPEVLRDEPSNEKSDIYSFGVILWELVTLQQPWSGLSPAQVVGAVGFQHRRLQIPKDVHPDIAVVIESCFANDPRQRPSFLSIMESLKALQKSPVTQPVGSVAT